MFSHPPSHVYYKTSFSWVCEDSELLGCSVDGWVGGWWSGLFLGGGGMVGGVIVLGDGGEAHMFWLKECVCVYVCNCDYLLAGFCEHDG